MLKAERFRRDGRSTSAQTQDRQSRTVSPRAARGVRPARSYDLFRPRSVSSLSQSGFESRGLSSPIWRGRRGRRCLCRFRLLIIHDQPRTALSGQEQPAPLQEHADFQTELRQKRDVNESPPQPRNETVQPKFAALQNCVSLAHDGHGAFVEVTKRLGRPLAGKLAPNQFSSIASLLHCNLSDARQRFSVLIERGRIAEHKNFRMIWNSKIGLNTHATGAIGLRP